MEMSEQPATPSKYAGLRAAITLGQYYGVGTIMAVGALGILSYYIYQSKKEDATPVN